MYIYINIIYKNVHAHNILLSLVMFICTEYIYTLFSPTATFVIEVPLPSHESGRLCFCVLGVSILTLSTIFRLDIKTVPSAWYILFSPGTMVLFTNKTDYHDIAEILLEVALNTINLNLSVIRNGGNVARDA